MWLRSTSGAAGGRERGREGQPRALGREATGRGRRTDERCDEADDQEVEDRVLGDDLAALAALLERVDGRPDLLGRREPEQHDRVEPVEEGDDERDREDDEEQVADDL